MPFTFTVTKTEVTRRKDASKNQQDAAEESTAIHFLSNEIKKLLTDLQVSNSIDILAFFTKFDFIIYKII